MKRLILMAGLLMSACSAPAPAWRVEGTIADADGKYDYITVDSVAHTAFIGRETGVMTLDLTTGKTGWILKRDTVAAPLILTDTPLMLSTNGGSDNVTLFDRRTGVVKADMSVGKGPDGAIYDPQTARAYVMNSDDRTISVIDVAPAKVVATWPVDGAPEGAALDGKGHLFVNLENKNAIARIDLASGAVTAHYSLSGCEAPTGLTYDGVTGLLIPACHNRIAKLIDAATGVDHGGIAIGAGADGSLFDPVSRIGYIPCIDGTLTIWRLDAQGHAHILQVLKTLDGARTAALDPATGKLYLPSAAVERDAAGDYVTARKNFKIVVVSQTQKP